MDLSLIGSYKLTEIFGTILKIHGTILFLVGTVLFPIIFPRTVLFKIQKKELFLFCWNYSFFGFLK